MNHKRHRTKKQRGGCLYCKPHKIMGNSDKAITFSDLRKKKAADEQIQQI